MPREIPRAVLDVRDPAFVQNPYPAYQRLRDKGPVFYWAERDQLCFHRAADLGALFRDRRLGREIPADPARAPGRPEIPARLRPFYDVDDLSMLQREPPAHTRLRGLVNRAFVSRRIEALRPRIAELAERLIAAFIGRGEAELIAEFAALLPLTVITEFFGAPPESAPRLRAWSQAMVAMYQFARTPAQEEEALAATAAFSDFLRRLIEERRARPGDDLISLLIAAADHGDALSEAELIATCILLLNAGHEASVHAFGNGVNAILAAGLAPETLFATPEQTEATIEECLRFDPPLHYFERFVREDFDFDGIVLAEGQTIGLLIGAANRDGARWAEPDRFDPFRAPAPHLSFGAGIHFCLGAPLARLEMQIALPILFARLPGLRRIGDIRYRDAFGFHGLETLPVVW